VAVASAGQYARLHLIPDNQYHTNIPSLSFLQAGCPSCRPTNSIKALKAIITTTTTIILQLFWILSGTTQVSQYQKGKTRKVKPIWIY